MAREYRKEKDGIIYEIAKPEHYEAVKRLFLHDFLEREPLAMAAGTNNKFRTDEEKENTDVRRWLIPLLESELSVLAKDVETNEIIGLRTCKILKKGCTKDPSIEGSISKYLEDIKNVDFFGRYDVDEVIEFVFLVVKHTHTRRGIAKELVDRAMELAKTRGYRAVIVSATNPITINMFEKQKFDMLKELSIDNYTIDGAKAFPDATEGQVGKLFGKALV